jgi:hypothetical protein
MRVPGSAGPRPLPGRGYGGILAAVRRGVALVEEKPCGDAMPSVTPSDRPGGLPTMNHLKAAEAVRTFSAVIERCADTGLLVGYVPGFPGAHSQGDTLDELQANLQEVIAMLRWRTASRPWKATSWACSRLWCRPERGLHPRPQVL